MKIIACYSNKGGVGKTATSVNLAYELARSGHRTLLCDLDPQGASGFYFRVKPSKILKNDSFFRDGKSFANAIRGSDFENLDILPSNMTYRDFDIFLSRMKKSRSRLKKAVKTVNREYDVILLDCPPTISSLSESVFKAADHIVVPVIPSTLSVRTFEQLVDFFRKQNLGMKKLIPFFSMVQRQKTLHTDTMSQLRNRYAKTFLDTSIPFSTDVEKMGIHRAPVTTFARSSPAAKAYYSLWKELQKRI